MRLLFTLTAYPPSLGGAQLHQHQLALRLRANHEITVLAFWDAHRTDWLLGTTITAPRAPRRYVIDGVPVELLAPALTDRLAMLPWVAAYYPALPIAARRIARRLETPVERAAGVVDLVHHVRI